MKIISRILMIALGCIVAAILLLYCSSNENSIAEDPNRIADAIDFDLPDYVVTQKADNLDRTASCWDAFEYHIRFNKTDVATMEKEMLEECKKNGHWYQHGDTISFYSESNDESAEPRFKSSGGLSTNFYHIIGSDSAVVCYDIQEFL